MAKSPKKLEAGGWQWRDLSPLTQVVVAAFTNSVGTGETQLSPEEFQAAYAEAFPRQSHTPGPERGRSSLMLARQAIVKAIHEDTPYERISEMAEDFSALTGNTEASQAWTHQIRRDIQVGNRIQALQPALWFLSEVALSRR